MKKLFVVLLILAVAGGVFAQEFSWSGEMKIGTIIDLNLPQDVGRSASIQPDDNGNAFGDERAHAAVILNYDNGGLHAELEFKGEFETLRAEEATPHITGTVSYEADDWKVQVGVGNIEANVNSASAPPATFPLSVASLWGYWYFLDQKILLDVAYSGRETIYWRVSDILGDNDWDNMDGKGGIEVNFMLMEGMSFGIKFGGYENGTIRNDPGYPITTAKFLNSFFKPYVLGFKFEQEAFALGFMYQNDTPLDATVFGSPLRKNFIAMAKFFLGDTMSVGGELLLGGIEAFGDTGTIGLGGNFDYHGDAINAGINVKLLGFEPASGKTGGNLVFAPYLKFEAIEDTFLLGLDVTFTLWAFRDNNSDAGMEVTPAIYWNPQGDGISDDPGKGLIFKIIWGINSFDIGGDSMYTRIYTGFCWSF